ncbi:MAG: glycoside hydrolase family 1 protein [Thermodesulfobacteriota bacterium]
METFRLPDDLLLGVATSATQIEGGETNHSWYRWSSQAGRTKDGKDTSVANDHWHRVDQDLELMRRLNVQTYRLGLEWSRLEPRPGEFSLEAARHYRDEISQLREAGLTPLVTLHHFSNPLWLEDDGGWTNPQVVGLFERYTDFCVRQLGDLVSDWVTINEPNVYLTFGYTRGIWPPGRNDLRAFGKGARLMIAAHIAAYRTIHRRRREMGLGDTKVGLAHHLRVFTPKHGRLLEKMVCRMYERLFHDMFIVGAAEGRLLPPLGLGRPRGRGDYQDFFGVNYYSRDIISFSPARYGEMFGRFEVKAGAPVNDLGWEIYPEGLYTLCARYYKRYGQPIYITENGTPDARDAFRAKYIYDHLRQIKLLRDDGVDVRRYYHWTLMDNFEWAEGYTARFGLIEVDFDTQARTIRPSGWFFRDVIRERGVTPAMIDQYLSIRSGG